MSILKTHHPTTALCTSANGVYMLKWCPIQEIVRRLCEQRQKISASADEQQDHAAQRGCDACGTATRISASLSRRLSASFRSASDQDPKAAKFAVLNPGHAGFPKRVERSEGSDTTPVRNAPVSPCVPPFSESRVCVPTFTRESERGPFVREAEKCDEMRFGTALCR